MEKLKIAVIGTGSISNYHIKAYERNPHAQLYAFCDIDGERLRAQGERYGISRLFTSVEEMLTRLPEIDAVSVCTWNSAHAPCAIAALEAGKHVLCEKPMALNADQALAMQRAAEKAGKMLMIGFVRRFGNDCAILKDLIANDRLGDVYYAKATYLRRNGNPGGWFGDKSRSGGGPLIDLGVHVIDLVRYLIGNPVAVSVYGNVFRKLGQRAGIKGTKGYLSASAGKNEVCDVEDLAVATIRFDSGAVLNVETSFALNIEKDETRIELFGTKGGARLDPDLKLFTEMDGYLTDVELAMPTALNFDGLFESEIDHFVDCATTGGALRAPASDGVEMMRILDAIYRSAAEGREIVLR